MKRSPLPPRTEPLRARVPLSPGGPIVRHGEARRAAQLPQRRAQPRRRDRGEEQDWERVVRPLAIARSQGHCEWCGLPHASVVDVHHRQLRSRGGPDHIANAVALHPLCHVASGPDGVHREEQHHRDRGFMLRSGDDPETAPLWLPGIRRVLLTADGRYVEVPP